MRLGDLPERDGAADPTSELTALRQEVEDLRRAVRARDDFIAIAAHELRNPMTPLLGVADLALAEARRSPDACPPRLTMLLERMQLIAHGFIHRATRLLDFSRIASGNLRLELATFDLSALVLSVAQRYEFMAAHVRCPIELVIQEGVSGAWDRLAVEQVIENLLSNALKFGAGKPLTMRLGSDGVLAVLEIQDRGVGMEAEQTARIFGRFEQIVSQQQGAGFGVGLWVSDRLVAAMGGRIEVKSELGKGSIFIVSLPTAPTA